MGFSMKVCGDGELHTTKNQTQYINKQAQIQTNIKNKCKKWPMYGVRLDRRDMNT